MSLLALMLTFADPGSYLMPVSQDMDRAWPDNRTVTIVCHGHSVPAGYFATPKVDTFNAYPHLLHAELKQSHPNAVINVVVTAIGGENSAQGAARFDRDALALRPDVVLIDYALNDRSLGLEPARAAWTSMVRKAQKAGSKVLLLTPTPDLGAKILDDADPLSLHAAQVRSVAAQADVGLVDVYAAFQKLLRAGKALEPMMSQSNHPNRIGHEVVVSEILKWFPKAQP